MDDSATRDSRERVRAADNSPDGATVESDSRTASNPAHRKAPKTRFDECLEFVLDREGRTTAEAPGDVNTSWGITQPTYTAWRRGQLLPTRNVDEGTPEEFRLIYEHDYWLAASCNKLPKPLDLLHFDSAVNLGVPTANRLLQSAAGLQDIDGVIGPKTLAAVEDERRGNPIMLCGKYCSLRIKRYLVLTTLDAGYRRYLRGWLHRVGLILQEL